MVEQRERRRTRGWSRQRFGHRSVAQRVFITRQVPSSGTALVASLIGINVLLGLLPEAFDLATSVDAGRVRVAVNGGLDSPVWLRIVTPVLACAASFVGR